VSLARTLVVPSADARVADARTPNCAFSGVEDGFYNVVGNRNGQEPITQPGSLAVLDEGGPPKP
jgi:hypothetical protein